MSESQKGTVIGSKKVSIFGKLLCSRFYEYASQRMNNGPNTQNEILHGKPRVFSLSLTARDTLRW
jgi:hypothetical protein